MKVVRPQYLRSEEHTSELQSRRDLVCRLLLEKKNTRAKKYHPLGGQERHVAAYDQIPSPIRRPLGRIFERSDDSTQRSLPGPTVRYKLRSKFHIFIGRRN